MAELTIKLVNGELAGKTMQGITKEITASAQALKKAEIGTKEWVDAQSRLNKAKDLQADLTKQINSTTSASSVLKDTFSKFTPFGSMFSGLGQTFSSLKGGVGGLTSSFGVLRTAIIATGIGALILAVMGLVTWFTKTETGADILAKASNIVGAVFRQLTESITRLMNLDFAGFFRGVTTEMADQVSAASELADAIDALEEKESAFQVVQKAGLRDKAELLKMAKDEQLSIQDRIAGIGKAMGISKALNDQEITNQREHLRIISGGTEEIADALISRLEKTGLTMENAKDFFKKGNITQEDLDEANAALGKFLDIQTKAFDEERELLTVRNKLNKKDASAAKVAQKEESAAQKKAKADELKELQEHLAAQDNLRKLQNDATVAAIDDEKEQEKKKLEFDTQDKIIALQGSEAEIFEQTKMLREIQGQALLDIDKKYADKAAAEKKKQDDEAVRLEKERNQLIISDAQQAAQLRLQLNAEILTGAVSLGAGLITQQMKDQEQAKKIRKAAAIIEIGINLQRELAAISLAASLNPLNGLTFGGAGAAQYAIQATLAKVRAGFSIASILAFRRGGIPSQVLRGPSHEGGGIPLVAEGNEIILTRGVYNNSGLRAMASAINVAGGGRSFSAGGPTNPFDQSRGPIASRSTAGAAPNLDNTIIVHKLDQLIMAIDARIDRLVITNNLQDVEKGLKTLQIIRDAGSF